MLLSYPTFDSVSPLKPDKIYSCTTKEFLFLFLFEALGQNTNSGKKKIFFKPK